MPFVLDDLQKGEEVALSLVLGKVGTTACFKRASLMNYVIKMEILSSSCRLHMQEESEKQTSLGQCTAQAGDQIVHYNIQVKVASIVKRKTQITLNRPCTSCSK